MTDEHWLMEMSMIKNSETEVEKPLPDRMLVCMVGGRPPRTVEVRMRNRTLGVVEVEVWNALLGDLTTLKAANTDEAIGQEVG